MKDFEGKVAVVTGAASGMGRGFAERFAQEGMKVVLADVEEPALATAVQELRHKEYDVVGVLTDVSKVESVEHLRDEALKAYGKVHIVCNNAGVGGDQGMLWESSYKDWQWTVGVNLWGVIHGIRAFVPAMLDQDEEGHIVNTASIAGLISGWGIYGMTKHAVVAMSESLSTQLRLIDSKIRVSVLCPSAVKTNIRQSQRNRPQELQNEDNSRPFGTRGAEVMKGFRERIGAALDLGKEPSEIAELVFNAIVNEEFYILTHPDDQEPRIKARFDKIMTREAPTPPRYAFEGEKRGV